MKKHLIWVGLIVTALLSGMDAKGIAYVDYDVINKRLGGGNPAITGNFNIATGDGEYGDISGYNPVSQQVISAFAWFVLFDIDGNQETVNIDLGGSDFASSAVSFGFTILGGLVSGEALLDLSADGVVSYTINWESGDSFVVSAGGLYATAGPRSIAVVDGGATMSLMGLSVLGLAWLSRKRKA